MEAVRIVMSGMWLQDAGSLSSGDSRLLVWLVGLIALGMIVQAIAVIVIAAGAAKASKRALEIADDLRTKMMPILDTTHSVLHDSAPKLKIITENLVETSHVVRSKAAEFDATASDLNMKTRAQAPTARVAPSFALFCEGWDVIRYPVTRPLPFCRSSPKGIRFPKHPPAKTNHIPA